MKYYITADIHGFYTEFHKALDEVGYFNDPEPHKLVILGDLLDRGQEAVEMQRFILSLLERGGREAVAQIVEAAIVTVELSDKGFVAVSYPFLHASTSISSGKSGSG